METQTISTAGSAAAAAKSPFWKMDDTHRFIKWFSDCSHNAFFAFYGKIWVKSTEVNVGWRWFALWLLWLYIVVVQYKPTLGWML